MHSWHWQTYILTSLALFPQLFIFKASRAKLPVTIQQPRFNGDIREQVEPSAEA